MWLQLQPKQKLPPPPPPQKKKNPQKAEGSNEPEQSTKQFGEFAVNIGDSTTTELEPPGSHLTTSEGDQGSCPTETSSEKVAPDVFF